MEVLESEQNLSGVELGLTEGELFPLDMKHEISSRDVLHDEVDSSLGLETRVQVEEERMLPFGGGEEDSFLGLRAVETRGKKRTTSSVREDIEERKEEVDREETNLSTSSFSMMNSFFSTLIA